MGGDALEGLTVYLAVWKGTFLCPRRTPVEKPILEFAWDMTRTPSEAQLFPNAESATLALESMKTHMKQSIRRSLTGEPDTACVIPLVGLFGHPIELPGVAVDALGRALGSAGARAALDQAAAPAGHSSARPKGL